MSILFAIYNLNSGFISYSETKSSVKSIDSASGYSVELRCMTVVCLSKQALAHLALELAGSQLEVLGRLRRS